MSSMCCTVIYIYMYVCIYFVVLGKGYLTFVACLQSLNFSLADFFLLLFCFRFVFSLCWPFFGKVVERAEQAQAQARHLCDPVDNMDQNTKSRSGRTAAAGSRQHATG